MKIYKRKLFIYTVLFALAGLTAIYAADSYVKARGSRFIADNHSVPDTDAIIVLGAYVFPDGRPSHMLKDRLDKGIELYKEGKAPKLLVSGDHGSKSYDEVNAMRKYAQNEGVPRQDIFMDHAGFNTYDSIYRARDVFMVKRAVIVTQEYHLKRALYIANKLGIEAYGIASEKRIYAGMDYYRKREIAARFKDFLQVEVLKAKPKYLGEIIPVWGDGSLTDDGKS